jgi:hypothetical protein
MGAATIEHPKTRSSAHADHHGPAPLYVVCSPSREVGKTLLARLLTDFCVANRRAVEAFDLADESPRLNDFAPDHAEVVDIGNVRSQVRLFDSLVAKNDVTKIIDVDRRQFGNFFVIANKIQLFEEARRQAIEPVLLFLIDPNPKAAKAYATLRDWFPEVTLLPVRNQRVARGIPRGSDFPHVSRLSVCLEIPLLSPGLQAAIDREGFSFIDLGHGAPQGLSRQQHDDLQLWFRRIRVQLQALELSLLFEQVLTALGARQEG